MLLPDNVHPKNSIYYNGAIVLKILQKYNELEMLELYYKANKEQAMSFPLFILCLDWLYLIDAAELKEERVELCS